MKETLSFLDDFYPQETHLVQVKRGRLRTIYSLGTYRMEELPINLKFILLCLHISQEGLPLRYKCMHYDFDQINLTSQTKQCRLSTIHDQTIDITKPWDQDLLRYRNKAYF